MNAHLNKVVELGLPYPPSRVAADGVQVSPLIYLDPIEEDRADDPVTQITHRQLTRLIFMAAQTGERFEREDLPSDPVEWLFTSKEMFDGQAAVDACRLQGALLRGIVLHALSLGLDADPHDLDELLVDEDDGGGCAPAVAAATQPMSVASIELTPA